VLYTSYIILVHSLILCQLRKVREEWKSSNIEINSNPHENPNSTSKSNHVIIKDKYK